MDANSAQANVAIVTAASRGIGAACARALKASGHRLSVMARSEGIHAIAAELDALAVQGLVNSAADLLSRESAYVTGQTIAVDGGQSRAW